MSFCGWEYCTNCYIVVRLLQSYCPRVVCKEVWINEWINRNIRQFQGSLPTTRKLKNSVLLYEIVKFLFFFITSIQPFAKKRRYFIISVFQLINLNCHKIDRFWAQEMSTDINCHWWWTRVDERKHVNQLSKLKVSFALALKCWKTHQNMDLICWQTASG